MMHRDSDKYFIDRVNREIERKKEMERVCRVCVCVFMCVYSRSRSRERDVIFQGTKCGCGRFPYKVLIFRW